eukprot:TRINITY_DN12373_c0_g1_i1.p1 TRINITY_DN12373_c0_g1~~TRINITY_DN12373_c0_g1_i1.p1  ORF type:complete len:171 (-),score=45.88 TRINITY_DN12373_c0_g1_i1:25-468(-)
MCIRDRNQELTREIAELERSLSHSQAMTIELVQPTYLDNMLQAIQNNESYKIVSLNQRGDGFEVILKFMIQSIENTIKVMYSPEWKVVGMLKSEDKPMSVGDFKEILSFLLDQSTKAQKDQLSGDRGENPLMRMFFSFYDYYYGLIN